MSLLTTTTTTNTTAAVSASSASRIPPPHLPPSSSRLPHPRPSSPLPLLFLFLLFLLHAPHPILAAVCSRADQSLRVCLLDVTLTRQSDCSLLVREHLHIRRTLSNNTLLRAIPTISGQHITQLRHYRDTIPVSIPPPDNRCAAADDHQQLITIPTIDFTPSDDQDAVHHELIYRLSNGVNIGSTRCAAPESPDENEKFNVTFVSKRNNVIRWRSGTWNEKIDRVKVTFVSPGKSLHRMGQTEEKNASDSISFSFNTDVNKDKNEKDSGKPFGTENREVYFVEFDNSGDAVKCGNLMCFTGSESQSGGGGGVNVGLVLGILAIIIVVIVVLCCVVTRFRKGGGGNAGGQHGMIFAEGMDSGTGGAAAAASGGQQPQAAGGWRQRRQQQQAQDDDFPFAI